MLESGRDESGEIVGYLALARNDHRPKALKHLPPNKENRSPAKKDVPEFFNPDVISAVSNAVTELNKEVEVDRFGDAEYHLFSGTNTG